MSASAGNFAFDQPFYRLSSEERVLLFVLHFGKWSYERVGRVVGKSKEAVAELVWSARMDLAFQPGQTVLLMHPFGTDAPGSRDCPEYYPRRPWTQNFLDEQLQAQEKHFLTAHLIECQRCQQALNRTRQIYYAVEAILPKTPDLDARVALFENILLKGRGITDPSSLSPHESLQIFFDRPETKRFLFGAIVFLGIVLFWWN
jgi:hypothetical protein